MATTNYGVNSPEAVKLWSRKLFHEALKSTWIHKFIGTDSNALLQLVEDTSKGPGDRVRVTLRMLLTGDGIQGDGTLEGNEEALTTYTDNVFIDQLRHAVRSGGKMSEQRIPFSVREEARLGLQDWWADRLDEWFFQQISGSVFATKSTKFTGNQAATAPNTANLVYGAPGTSVVTDGSVMSATVANKMSLSMIDALVLKAKTLTPQIRPVRVNGADHWVLFVHPEQSYDLRNSARSAAEAVTSWQEIQQAAIKGGDISGNPIFTGALGMYNNTIIHESTRVPMGISNSASVTGARRAIFCGAQAAALAFGQGYGPSRMSWVEELFDYRNQLGVSAGLIGGLKKTIFNSLDFGTIVQVTSRTTAGG
jgi:N4-gp56 family major capsid protein